MAMADNLRFPLTLQAKAGGGEGIRTPYLLVANEALYQMSYTPNGRYFTVMVACRQRFTYTTTALNQEPANPNLLSLDELNLTPAWLKTPAKSFDKHPGETRAPKSDRGDRDRRPPAARRDDRRPDRRDDRRRPAPGPGGPRRERSGPAPVRRPVSAPPPPLDVDITFLPNVVALTGITDMVKQSARAYALFDLAKLVLNKPERHTVKFTCKTAVLTRLATGDGVFLSADEALRYLFRHSPDTLFTRTEKPVDPPKGNFQFINRCGMTGEILGPPNFHEYQTRLVKHHQQRLAHVPFEQFRSRIETIRDPEVVKAWVESRSKMTEYTCRLCTEPKAFTDRGELEKHIRADHLPALVTTANTVEIAGTASRQIENGRLLEAVRQGWESERRFPLKTVNELRPHLSQAGFNFFKHKKSITYITRVKPTRFESVEHLSEQVQKILTFLRTHADATRKQLAESLAPVNETQLAADLHWLIQDGYVVEFYDGKLWALEEKTIKPATPAAPVPAPASTEPPPPAAT